MRYVHWTSYKEIPKSVTSVVWWEAESRLQHFRIEWKVNKGETEGRISLFKQFSSEGEKVSRTVVEKYLGNEKVIFKSRKT